MKAHEEITRLSMDTLQELAALFGAIVRTAEDSGNKVHLLDQSLNLALVGENLARETFSKAEKLAREALQ